MDWSLVCFLSSGTVIKRATANFEYECLLWKYCRLLPYRWESKMGSPFRHALITILHMQLSPAPIPAIHIHVHIHIQPLKKTIHWLPLSLGPRKKRPISFALLLAPSRPPSFFSQESLSLSRLLSTIRFTHCGRPQTLSVVAAILIYILRYPLY